MVTVRGRFLLSAAIALGVAWSSALPGQVVHEKDSELARLAIGGRLVAPPAATAPLEPREATDSVTPGVVELAAGVGGAWSEFLDAAPGRWRADVDLRTGRIGFVEGEGLPWIPGAGNRLTLSDVRAPLDPGGDVGLATLEALAREFAARHATLLGVDPASLRLAPGRSGRMADYLWYVDFDVLVDGAPVEGARLLFRINNGNLVQFGSENLPPLGAEAPAARIDRDTAWRTVDEYVGAFDPLRDELVDSGSLRLLPVSTEAERAVGVPEPGVGLELVRVWQFVFRRGGVPGTWRARVEATGGELVELVDVNEYAQVTGGVRAGDNLPADTIRPMPFANVSSGGFTNSAGIYTFVAGPVTSTLNGQYVRILDNCGAISQSSDASGNILFGTSGGTDCTTPGSGGAGNTHAARTQFYHLNRTKEAARGWLPANAWINAQLTANVNLNQTCNAYWNGATVNFFRSGGGCANTGELPGVSLHEYGHGLDSNDGNGSPPDNGTGETYGDFTAALATHDSCIGGGFLGGNCGGYGNGCTACTGVRDIDWARHVRNTPSTVENFTRTTCPQPSPTNPNYVGPCGRDAINDGVMSRRREGHCESYVSSEALWDFPERDLPSPGSGAAWSVADRLWFLSRPTATAAFVCETSAVPWTSTGCAAGTAWRTMRAADDDDGNLANGTPHSCQLFAAFNRHGIACAADAGANTCFSGCVAPATPVVTPTPGNNQVALSWTNSGAGVVYDVYRNEVGCDAGFVRIATGLAATSHVDTAVANGATYYYQVTAYPTGNSACASVPAACVSATPTSCSPIAAPGGIGATVTGPNQIAVAWNDSTTAATTSYAVLRGTAAGGPYVTVGTVPDGSPGTGGSGSYSFPDGGVSGGTTYFYVVRALASGGCESLNSAEVSVTATGDCTLAPGFGGLQTVTALGGGQGCGLRLAWNAGTSSCGGGLTYSVHRSTVSGFTPSAANRIASCVAGNAWDDTTMPIDTPVFYVVRAEDGSAAGGGGCNGGNTDANLVERSGFASSTGGAATLYTNGFETGTGLGDWVTGLFGGDDAVDWRGIQTCAAHGGTRIFRFGGAANCTADYTNNDFTFAQPDGADGIAIPAGSTTLRLDFWHRWAFESGWDGAALAVSFDGTNYTLVPASAILANPYNGTTDNGAGFPAWTGTQAAFVNTIVNLDAACVAAGASGGCAGQALRIAFVAYSDTTITNDGWFLDDVTVTRDAVPACTAAPQPVRFLTATGKDQQVSIEWLTPAGGPFASTRLRTSTASYPADPNAGTLLVNEPGIANEKELFVHATGAGSNGVAQFYSAFANSGAGVFSARTTVGGLPQSTAGPWKWNFSSSAAALAPPLQGRGLGVFVPSNDRAFYGLAIGAAGGVWKAGFRPGAMNGPAQGSPIVLLAAESGLPHDAAFVGSQDGFVYCFHAGTGAGCTGWPAGGRSASGFGFVQAQPIYDPVTQRLLFGTRNATGANGFHAVNGLDGTTAWSFTNSVPQGGDGQAMGIVSGPALILGNRAVFASRTRVGGSSHSLWAVDFTASTVGLAWTRDLGDIDGAPTHDWIANRVLVGTNAGAVFALATANGANVWTRSFGDGPIKSWIYYDATRTRLYFASNTTVRGIPASGATGSDWSVGGLISPTRPILHFGTSRAYLGACADAACTNGRVIELDAANSWATPKTLDLAAVGGLGPVTIDRTQNLLHAGSRTGRVHAVAIPLP